MARNLLYEMAVHSESDVFNMNPVASVSTEATNNLEGEELRRYVYQTIQPTAVKLNCNISEDDIGVLIRHHCSYRPRKKAALLALPYIVSANLVTAPWRKQVDKKGKLRKGRDRRPSGMISAPIMIDGVKYLCNITNKTNLQGRIALYALTLKDGNGNIVESEKMADPSNVPHSNSEQSANGNAHINNVTTSHEPNPSFQGAKVQQNIETNNNNDIKTENIRMNKKQIRLTESDLKQIVKESVNKILNEAYGTPNKWTTSATYNINQARNDDRNYIKNADNETVNASLADFLNDMLHVSDKLSDQNDVLRKLDGKYNPYASPSYKPYVQALYKIGDKLTFIVNRMISIANMEEGEQPDEYYDINHESYKQKQKRLNYGGIGNGSEDRHDYSGLAGWGG